MKADFTEELQTLSEENIFSSFKMKMNVEVSDPIDFNSGDHQHLVRNTADRASHANSGQPYTSPEVRPQQAKGNPRPKTNERPNTYIVQISEDVTPDDSNVNSSSPFSDINVRRGFIIKVFVILSVQLLVTAAIISMFVFWKALKVWVIANPWFTYALFPAFFAVLIVLACCGNLRRQVPANYILLGFFLFCIATQTLLQGLLLGTVSVGNIMATAATTIVTLALTLFALQTKWDFTLLSGALFVFLFVLMIYGIVLVFVRSYWMHVFYAGLGTVLFSLYLVMDVQLMVGGYHHHSNLDPEEYVFAALNIYLDIINLFLFILQLIGLGGSWMAKASLC